MNSILCNARLRCADVSSDVRTRLHIDSCAKCDLYESSVNPKKQDDVCQRRYGCRREKDEKYLDAPIKVRMLWSVSGRSTPRNSSTISTTTGASYSSHSSTSNEKYTSYKRRLAALKGHAKRTKKHKDWCKKDSKLINILTAEVNKKAMIWSESQRSGINIIDRFRGSIFGGVQMGIALELRVKSNQMSKGSHHRGKPNKSTGLINGLKL